MMKRLLTIGLAFSLALTASAGPFCMHEEETPAQKKHKRDLEDDAKLGSEYAKQIDKELKPSKNEALVARVQKIGKEMADIANITMVRVSWGDKRLNPFTYTFKVVEGKDVNAFSLPGGTIYVYEGLLQYAETDDELAGVLAHEVAHASLRHIATLRQESSKLSSFTIPLILISILTANPALASATGMLGQAIGSGWSVKAETAADLAAFDYMRQSKYDPAGILTLMERLAYDERNRPQFDWGIYRTHPPSSERASALRDLLAEVKHPIRRSVVTTTLRATPKPQEDGSVQLVFAGRRLFTFYGEHAKERAEESAKAINACFDRVPKLHEVTAFDGDSVEYQGAPLIQITDADEKGSGKPLSELLQSTLGAVKAGIYDLRYRVWDFFAR